MVRCSYARVCSTLSELVDLDILQREKSGRNTVYRVIYNDGDRLLFGNVWDGPIGSETASNPTETGCRSANSDSEIGCRADLGNRGNRPQTAPQEITLNVGRDYVETWKKNSSEDARLPPRNEASSLSPKCVGEHLARLERALKSGASIDRMSWSRWLDGLEPDDLKLHHWKVRLNERLVCEMTDEEYEEWCETHGHADGDGNSCPPLNTSHKFDGGDLEGDQG